MILYPKKKVNAEPIIKNGPKGTASFIVFCFLIKSGVTQIAPTINDKKTIIKISGQPKIRPKAPTSLKSPQPIARPLVKIIMAAKKAIAIMAAKK